MRQIVKSLLMLLAISALCNGERKKSEKRDIIDFGSGFSTSKLEGSGIKISTDFGKEITLEEYKRNGYSFINDNNPDIGNNFNFALNDNNGNYDFTKNFGNHQQLLAHLQQNNLGNEQQILAHLQQNNLGNQQQILAQLQQNNLRDEQQILAHLQQNNLRDEQQILAHLQQNNGIVPNINNVQNLLRIQSAIQNQGAHLSQISNENQLAAIAQAIQNNQGSNNKDSSSVSYITQNIPIPQPYPVQYTNSYPVQPASAPNPQPDSVPQKQETPVSQSYPAQQPSTQQYPVNAVMSVSPENESNQDTVSTSEQEKALSEEKNAENSIQHYSYNPGLAAGNNQEIPEKQKQQALPSQNTNQVITHESDTTFNNGFVPSSFQGKSEEPSLFTPQSDLNNRQKLQPSDFQSNQADIIKNLQNAQNQVVLSNFAQNLQSGYSQRFNGPSNDFQQFQHALQTPGVQSALFNTGQGLHLPNQGHLYTNVNSGLSFAPNLQQGSQIPGHQYMLTGVPNQGQLPILNQFQINAPQPKINGYNAIAGNNNGQRIPENIQQILHTGQNYPTAQQTNNAKM